MSIVPQFLSFQTHQIHTLQNSNVCNYAVFSNSGNKLHHIRLPNRKLLFFLIPFRRIDLFNHRQKKKKNLNIYRLTTTSNDSFTFFISPKKKLSFLLLCFVLMRSRQNHPHDTIHRSKHTRRSSSVSTFLSLVFFSHRIIIGVYDKKARIKEKKAHA